MAITLQKEFTKVTLTVAKLCNCAPKSSSIHIILWHIFYTRERWGLEGAILFLKECTGDGDHFAKRISVVTLTVAKL